MQLKSPIQLTRTLVFSRAKASNSSREANDRDDGDNHLKSHEYYCNNVYNKIDTQPEGHTKVPSDFESFAKEMVQHLHIYLELCIVDICKYSKQRKDQEYYHIRNILCFVSFRRNKKSGEFHELVRKQQKYFKPELGIWIRQRNSLPDEYSQSCPKE